MIQNLGTSRERDLPHAQLTPQNRYELRIAIQDPEGHRKSGEIPKGSVQKKDTALPQETKSPIHRFRRKNMRRLPPPCALQHCVWLASSVASNPLQTLPLVPLPLLLLLAAAASCCCCLLLLSPPPIMAASLRVRT